MNKDNVIRTTTNAILTIWLALGLVGLSALGLAAAGKIDWKVVCTEPATEEVKEEPAPVLSVHMEDRGMTGVTVARVEDTETGIVCVLISYRDDSVWCFSPNDEMVVEGWIEP